MYQDDTLESSYDGLVELEAEIVTAAESLKGLGAAEANAIAEYESRKNVTLIELFAEEADPEYKGKRTEAQRTSIYRELHKEARLSRSLATAELKAQQDYIRSMLAVLNSRQSRLRILESERKTSSMIPTQNQSRSSF